MGYLELLREFCPEVVGVPDKHSRTEGVYYSDGRSSSWELAERL